MVIVLQLLIFGIAFAIRGRFFFGKHLKQITDSRYLTYSRRNDGKIIARHVGILQENGIPFIIKRERWYHQFLKAMGIASEIKVGDDSFDTKYFITTDSPGHLERALASSPMHQDLQALFALPIKSLHATSSRIWCVCKKTDLEQSEEHYKTHRDLLDAISKRTRQSQDSYGLPEQRRHLRQFALFFLAAHAGLITLGIFGALPTLADSIDTLDSHLLAIKGATAGLVVAGIWLLLIFSIFSRSSWVCWVLVDFLICGLIGFMLSGMFVVREANVHLAQPAPNIVETPITQKICTLNCSKRCGKRCTRTSTYTFYADSGCSPHARETSMQQKKQVDSICRSSAYYSYTMQTQDWRRAGMYRFTPMLSLFDQVRVGDSLAIPVNTGALGLDWVDTDTITPSQ